jgi:hypothetical protein
MVMNVITDAGPALESAVQAPAPKESATPVGFLTKKQVLERIPVCRRTFDEWLRKGLIPVIRLPRARRVLFHWPSVEAALRRYTTGG